mmetsp:Transcript_44116/g.50993  ORF Transcript_44116/g.50993 Transcript_44116/m.50993 type:complete len:378 (+) Transcript_44116:31-1164(+)
MVDWPGLFKWSVQYHDGTTHKNIGPMDAERRKWLQEAMEAYTFDEVKRMKEVVLELAKPEEKTKEDGEKRVDLLIELEDLVEGLSNATDLHKIGGFSVLIDTALYSSYDEVRNQAYTVFASCCQNNTWLQLIATELGAPLIMNSIIKEESMKNKESAVTALSSYLRGENLKGKRRFIDWEGVEFLLSIIKDKEKYSSLRLQSKVFFLLQDLIYYDDKLHFEDMITYTKVSGDMPVMTYNNKDEDGKVKGAGVIDLKGAKTDSKEEKKEEASESKGKEEQPLSAYKDIVKKKLMEKGFLDIVCSYLTTDDLKGRLTLRRAAVSIIEILEKFGKLKLDEKLISALSTLLEALKKTNKDEQELYEIEIELITTVLKSQEQ